MLSYDTFKFYFQVCNEWCPGNFLFKCTGEDGSWVLPLRRQSWLYSAFKFMGREMAPWKVVCRHFPRLLLLFSVITNKSPSEFIISVKRSIDVKIQRDIFFFPLKKAKEDQQRGQFNPVFWKVTSGRPPAEEMWFSQVSLGQPFVPCFLKGTVCLRGFPHPSAPVHQWLSGSSCNLGWVTVEICLNDPGWWGSGAHGHLCPRESHHISISLKHLPWGSWLGSTGLQGCGFVFRLLGRKRNVNTGGLGSQELPSPSSPRARSPPLQTSPRSTGASPPDRTNPARSELWVLTYLLQLFLSLSGHLAQMRGSIKVCEMNAWQMCKGCDSAMTAWGKQLLSPFFF